MNNFENIQPEHLLKTLDLFSAPVDIKKVVSELKIELVNGVKHNLDCSGSISHIDGKTTIWVNPFELLTRQRFTMAHEVGHYINDLLPFINNGLTPPSFEDGSATLRRDGRQDPKEFKANDFAARLLMPVELLTLHGKELMERLPKSKEGKVSRESFIQGLAEKFNVSFSAMEVRLKVIGYIKR